MRSARPQETTGGVLPALIVECDREPASAQDIAAVASNPIDTHEQSAAARISCSAQAGSLGALDPRGSAVGFHVLARSRRRSSSS